MFTGLIEELGTITAIEPVDDSLRLTVRGPKVVADAKHGDSICVSGTCLTVIEQTEDSFTADVMAQTINMSAVADLTVGSPVNLERAARAGDRLGGHIVQGHVDGVAELAAITDSEQWRVLRFNLNRELAAMLVDKGSVTVSGVSLTVSTISDPSEKQQWFEVSLIPETLVATILGGLQVGDRVNIETDMLARHVARMMHFPEVLAQIARTEQHTEN
jgi:riboflavin synthase